VLVEIASTNLKPRSVNELDAPTAGDKNGLNVLIVGLNHFISRSDDAILPEVVNKNKCDA
jgi:hypothetical protein